MNINDYLIWRGDLPFKDFKFNEVDSLILARISYLPFDKINFNDGDTIYEIYNKMQSVKDYKIAEDEILIKNLSESGRFKDLKLSDYIINSSKESEKQFGAISVHLDDFIYVSYIGTDNSIVGWKEDFNMSFMKHVPAQLEGVKYLNNICNKYDSKVMLGGHSKGGNVAIYSALYTKHSNKIICVNNFDGPGFDNSVIEKSNNKEVINRIITYIPKDSVIGRLLQHREKSIVVKSVNKGIYQHDIYSWSVIKDSLVKLTGVSETSEFTNKTINQWLMNTDSKNRKIFVDSIFELFYSSNSNSFHEFSKTWIKDLPQMMEVYKEISKEDKKIISEMVKQFGKASSIVLKEEGKKKIDNIKDFNFDRAN